MLTTLSIISLDQGKIWRDPSPLPRVDATTAEPVGAPATSHRSRFFSVRPPKWGMSRGSLPATVVISA